jgi:hypothetical protein
MPGTPIAASTRYTSRGTAKYYWVLTIANYQSPTGAELNAGTDLSPEVMDLSGFGLESDQIDTPDVSARFTKKIPGPINADDSTLTMYPSVLGTDARQLMPQDTAGYIVIFPGGYTTGRKMHIWPVRVASVKYVYSASGSDPDTMVFTYSPTATPAENVTIP